MVQILAGVALIFGVIGSVKGIGKAAKAKLAPRVIIVDHLKSHID